MRERCLGIFLLAILSVSTASAASSQLEVDLSKQSTPVPGLFAPDVWIQNLANASSSPYLFEKLFDSGKPAVIHLTLSLLQFSKNLQDYEQQLIEHFNTPGAKAFIDGVKSADTRLLIAFDPCPIPPWLSSRPDRHEKFWSHSPNPISECSPPSDYELWGKIVAYTLRHIQSLGVKKLGLIVGHEPNGNWLGSEKEFFEYYRAAARAAKAINPDIQVGGPGPWDYLAAKLPCDDKIYTQAVMRICRVAGGWAEKPGQPMIETFIQLVAANDAPLDFINWHSFGALDIEFPIQARTIRSWLSESSLQNVKLYPSDWTYWSGPYPADYLDSSETAAYIVSSLIQMWQSGIEWHGYDYDVRDYGLEKNVRQNRGGATFIGDWGLLTMGGQIGGGVVKPAYNAFVAIKNFTDGPKTGLLNVSSTGDAPIEAVSSVTKGADGTRISILASYYVPAIKPRYVPMIFVEYSQAAVRLLAPHLDDSAEGLKACIAEQQLKSQPRDKRAALINGCVAKTAQKITKAEDKETFSYLVNFTLCAVAKRSADTCFEQPGEASRSAQTRTIESWLKAHLLPTEATAAIDLRNLPAGGTGDIAVYRISDTFSNACRENRRTEKSATNEYCGMQGEIDTTVRSAVQKAKQAGMQRATQVLRNHGYSEADIEKLKQSIIRCSQHDKLSNCLANLKSQIQRSNRSFSKGDAENLKNAVQAARAAAARKYYEIINKINSSGSVSFVGSKRVMQERLSGNNYATTIKMSPNSVLLFEMTVKK